MDRSLYMILYYLSGIKYTLFLPHQSTTCHWTEMAWSFHKNDVDINDTGRKKSILSVKTPPLCNQQTVKVKISICRMNVITKFRALSLFFFVWWQKYTSFRIHTQAQLSENEIALIGSLFLPHKFILVVFANDLQVSFVYVYFGFNARWFFVFLVEGVIYWYFLTKHLRDFLWLGVIEQSNVKNCSITPRNI